MPSFDSSSTVPFRAQESGRVAIYRRGGSLESCVIPASFPDVLVAPEPGSEDEPPVAETSEEVEARVTLAKEQGFREGYEKARKEAEVERQHLQEHIRGAVDVFRKGLSRVEDEMTRDVVRLGMAIAEHVLRRSFEVDIEGLINSVEPAVEALGGDGEFRIVCAPATGSQLSEHVRALQARFEVPQIDIEMDESFAVGDAVLQRGDATVDARLEGRLDHLKALLFGELGLDGGSP